MLGQSSSQGLQTFFNIDGHILGKATKSFVKDPVAFLTQRYITNRRSWFCIAILNLALVLLLHTPRSFGGDFWLHLWLIELQSQSVKQSFLPSFLVSFSPLGSLHPVSLFSGGISYWVLGLLRVSGIELWLVAMIAVSLAINLLSYSCRRLAQNLELSKTGVDLMTIFPLTFSFMFGDGLGRGSLSSFIAGLLLIALVVEMVSNCYLGISSSGFFSQLRIYLLSTFALGTHLPSTLICLATCVPILGIALLSRAQPIDVLVRTATSYLAGVLSSAMFWVPSLFWARASTFNGIEQFQADASSAFANPKILFGLYNTIPEDHIDAWKNWIGRDFRASTSLIVTQPSLLIALVILLAFRARLRGDLTRDHHPRQKLFYVGLTMIICAYVLVMFVSLWSFFPGPIRSLQYTFRLLYVPIAGWILLLAYVLSMSVKNSSKITWSLVLVTLLYLFQSTWQIHTTTNLSRVKSIAGDVFWAYDQPPSRVLENFPDAPFWYAASEQRVVFQTPQIADSVCKNVQAMRMTGWPRSHFVSLVNKDTDCLLTDISVPVSWLRVSGVKESFRDEQGHLVLKLNHLTTPGVGIRASSPLGLSIAASVFSALCWTILSARMATRKRLTDLVG